MFYLHVSLQHGLILAQPANLDDTNYRADIDLVWSNGKSKLITLNGVMGARWVMTYHDEFAAWCRLSTHSEVWHVCKGGGAWWVHQYAWDPMFRSPVNVEEHECAVMAYDQWVRFGGYRGVMDDGPIAPDFKHSWRVS